ncbi:MAG TPA: hypothetical protein VGP72_30880 [Planctomycetota bacterium]|jgi:hypothetical protein
MPVRPKSKPALEPHEGLPRYKPPAPYPDAKPQPAHQNASPKPAALKPHAPAALIVPIAPPLVAPSEQVLPAYPAPQPSEFQLAQPSPSLDIGKHPPLVPAPLDPQSRVHFVRRPFEDARPGVLSVCCSDGRYIDAIEEFLFAQGTACHDLLAFPGGPARLCMEHASIFEVSVATEALDFLLRTHQCQRVLLVSHVDCGYYRHRYGSCDVELQKEDLRRAAARIQHKNPNLKVECYLARPKTGKREDGFAIEEIMGQRE